MSSPRFVKIDGRLLPCINRLYLTGLSYHDPYGDPKHPQWSKVQKALQTHPVAILTDEERLAVVGVFEVGNISLDVEGLKLKVISRVDAKEYPRVVVESDGNRT